MASLSLRHLNVTTEQLQQLQHTQNRAFPELEAARQQRQRLEHAPKTQRVLQQTRYLMTDLNVIPQTAYTAYRGFHNSGERGSYETPYFLKRAKLSASALRLFLGQMTLKDVVQDYLWNICEESDW